jgi:hypothetical protein
MMAGALLVALASVDRGSLPPGSRWEALKVARRLQPSKLGP